MSGSRPNMTGNSSGMTEEKNTVIPVLDTGIQEIPGSRYVCPGMT